MAVGRRCHADDRLVECDRPGRAVELRVAVGEDAAVGRHEPVAVAVGGRCHADDRLVECDRPGRAVELRVSVGEDATVGGHQPVALPIGRRCDRDDGMVERQAGGRTVGGRRAEVPHAALGVGQPEVVRGDAGQALDAASRVVAGRGSVAGRGGKDDESNAEQGRDGRKRAVCDGDGGCEDGSQPTTRARFSDIHADGIVARSRLLESCTLCAARFGGWLGAASSADGPHRTAGHPTGARAAFNEATSEGNESFATCSAGHDNRTESRQRAARADVELVNDPVPAGLYIEELPVLGGSCVDGARVRPGRTGKGELARRLFLEATDARCFRRWRRRRILEHRSPNRSHSARWPRCRWRSPCHSVPTHTWTAHWCPHRPPRGGRRGRMSPQRAPGPVLH